MLRKLDSLIADFYTKHRTIPQIYCASNVYDLITKELGYLMCGVREEFRYSTPWGSTTVQLFNHYYCNEKDSIGLEDNDGHSYYIDLTDYLNKPKVVTKHKCTCPSHIIFYFGCKCGGI